MSIWQIAVLLAMATCAIGCLLGICISLSKMAKGIATIGTAITKMNEKLEGVDAVNRYDAEEPPGRHAPDPSFEDIEAAISHFEKLKRVDLTKPEGRRE